MKGEKQQRITCLASNVRALLEEWASKQITGVSLSFEPEFDTADLPDLVITDPENFHLCIEFFKEIKSSAIRQFVPVLLIESKGQRAIDRTDLDKYFDDVIWFPGQVNEFKLRMEMLLATRKRSELALELEELTATTARHEIGDIAELIRFAIDLADVGIYQVDENGSIMYVNKYSCTMTGYSREELISMKIYQLDPDFDEAGFVQNRKKIKSGGPATFITNHKRKDGSILPVEVTISYFEYKGATLSFSFARDITERVRWENRLIRSEEQNRRIIEATEVGTWSWNVVEDTLEINDRWAEICGYTREELSPCNRSTWAKLIHPDDRVYTETTLTEYLERRIDFYKVEFRMVHKTGRHVWILSTGKTTLRDSDGAPLRLDGTHLDISDRMEAKLELENSREMYRQLVENINDVIYYINNQGIFAYVSPSIIKLTGYPNTWYIGKLFTDVIFPDDRKIAAEIFNSHIKGHDSPPFDIRLVRNDDSPLWIRASSKPVYENGILIGLRGSAADISHRKEAERLQIEARVKAEESDRLKTAFLANISHEIRTPMNGIVGFAHLLRDSNIAEERKGMFLEQIQKSADRMLNLINDLVDISLIDSEDHSVREDRINLYEFFDDLKNQHAELNEKKALSIHYIVPSGDEDINIISDKQKLHTILSNLLKNAIKFTASGTIEAGCKIEKKQLKFFVTDTGTGIDPDIEPVMFERFSKTERTPESLNQGPGLGLSIAKAFVEQLGGTLIYKTAPGKGTSFYFSIELKSDCVTKNDGSGNRVVKLAEAVVLIAEDDEINFIYLKEVLASKVAKILHAGNGGEALNMVKSQDNISFVLMDLKLPGINGLEATREIKKIRPDLPVVAYTAYSRPEDKMEAIKAGLDGYLTKPVDSGKLLGMITRMLNREMREN